MITGTLRAPALAGEIGFLMSLWAPFDNMIKTKTTMILGAGASAPYGYPTGAELKEAIIQLANSICMADQATAASFKGVRVHSELIECARTMFTNQIAFDDKTLFGNREKHQEFLHSFQFDQSSNTIDRFLYDHSEFEEIGRFYAVLVLLICQYANQFTPSRGAFPKLFDSGRASTTDDWYAALVTRLRSGCDSAETLESLNNLQILTFNYDRSLDLYLRDNLANTSRHKGADWEKAVSLHHLYGELPEAPIAPNLIDLKELPIHAWHNRKKIRLIGDRSAFNQEKIGELMEDSERVVFIGFGFDDDNNRRLGLPNVLKGKTVDCHNYAPKADSHVTGTNRRTRNLHQSWHIELEAERRQLKLIERQNQYRQLGVPKDQKRTVIPFEREDFYEASIEDDIQAGLLGFS